MAKSVDNFSDLKELGIDSEEEDSEDSSLTQVFYRAADHLQNLLPHVDSEMLLTLYGYYKQGTEGACDAPKPKWFDMKAKAKWEAWKNLGSMPSGEAKSLYIKSIKKLDPYFDDSSSPGEPWVRVSMMQDEDSLPDSEKTLVDYIKEGNAQFVDDYLKENECCKSSLNRTDDDGLAPIHWAADSGFSDVIKVLINAGADVNLQDAEGQTALHYASSCGHVECVKFLLENGGKGDIVDGENNTPISVAADDSVRELFSDKL